MKYKCTICNLEFVAKEKTCKHGIIWNELYLKCPYCKSNVYRVKKTKQRDKVHTR